MNASKLSAAIESCEVIGGLFALITAISLALMVFRTFSKKDIRAQKAAAMYFGFLAAVFFVVGLIMCIIGCFVYPE